MSTSISVLGRRVCFCATFLFTLLSVTPANAWIVRSFHASDGLVHEMLRDIVKTPDGSIWFATWGGGISRLQGASWKTFAKSDGLPSNAVRTLLPVGKEGIWAGTAEGIGYFNGTTWSAVPAAISGLATPSVFCISRLPNGVLWFGTKKGRILQFLPDSRQTNFESDRATDMERARVPTGTWSVILGTDVSEGHSVRDILQLKSGEIWVAIDRLSIAVYDGRQWQLRWGAVFEGQQIQTLFQSRDGAIWCGGGKFIRRFDGKRWSTVPDAGKGSVCIAQSTNGELFLGTRNGIRVYQNAIWQNMTLDEKRPVLRVEVVTALDDGSVWVGTKEGAYRILPAPWSVFEYSDDGVRLDGSTFYTDPETPPLAIDVKGRLLRFDGEKFKPVIRLRSNNIPSLSFTRPSKGTIWILFQDYVAQYSLDENRIVRSVSIPQVHGITGLFQSKSGHLYLFGDAGVYELRDSEWRNCRAGPKYSRARTHVHCMEEQSDGSLLLGMNDAVERWHGDQVETLVPKEEYFVEKRILAICIDRNGRLLFGTSGSGLVIYNGNSWRQITMRDGLLSNHVSCLYESSDGTLWVGSRISGVSSYRDGRWIGYSRSEGLPTGGTRFLGEYPKGAIWVSIEGGGVCRYRPTNEGPNTAIQEFYPKILPNGRGAFSFSGLDSWNLTPREDLVFSWRLVRQPGFAVEAPWSPFSKKTIAITDPLAPGHYTFEVRAADKDRNIDPTPASTDIEVLVPTWRTVEFLLPVSFLLLIALGALVVVYRKHRALKASEAKYRDLVDNALAIILKWDADGHITFWNQYAERFFGFREEEVLGTSVMRTIFPEEDSVKTYLEDLKQEMLRNAGSLTRLQTENVTKGGERVWVSWIYRPILNERGDLVELHAFGIDVTQQHRAEAEKVSLEKQLLQSQKMEAVGQLAGGIAHDFNNLLQGMLGYTDLVMTDLSPTDKHYEDLEQVRKAAERAATLTRQLLAFSRRQILEPVDLDLNQVISEHVKMLRRIIGENVTLSLNLSATLDAVRADPTMIEQVLLNLSINSRDAMPEGGELTIETRNVVLNDVYREEHPWTKPGRYALLSVTDTGTGMAPEVLRHVFEPFFTTKEVGKGSGLGLSMVYGIVKQHEGFIDVSSQPDVGTTSRVYLPVIEHKKEDVPDSKLDDHGPGGTETILLAEDEETVREFAVRVLRDKGYRVLTAKDGEEAVRVFEANREAIDLALLDVVMPKLGGRAVSDRITSLKPSLRVLFSSGYLRGAQHTGFVLEKGMQLIQKPYTPADLLRKVREALDRT